MNSTTPPSPAQAATATPGPWHVEGEGARMVVRGPDMTIVAVRHRLPAEEHVANARLIAAAPSLRDALHNAVAMLDALLIHDDPVVLEALTAARAALTFATARQDIATTHGVGGDEEVP